MTILELATLLDISPSDALDEAIKAGVLLFWLNGLRCNFETARRACSEFLKPDIEFDATAELEAHICAFQSESSNA